MKLRVSAAVLAACFLTSAAVAQSVTQRDLIGRWAERGDCRDWMAYSANGTWSRADGSSGEWALEGNTITASVDGGNGASSAIVRKLPDGSIARTAAFDGHTDHLTRCAVTPARRPTPRRHR